jgi:hypothetical protein
LAPLAEPAVSSIAIIAPAATLVSFADFPCGDRRKAQKGVFEEERGTNLLGYMYQVLLPV